MENGNYPLPEEFLEECKNAKSEEQVNFIKVIIATGIFSPQNQIKKDSDYESKIKYLKEIDENIKKQTCDGKIFQEKGLYAFSKIFQENNKNNNLKYTYNILNNISSNIEYVNDKSDPTDSGKKYRSRVEKNLNNLLKYAEVLSKEWFISCLDPDDKLLISTTNIIDSYDRIPDTIEKIYSIEGFKDFLNQKGEYNIDMRHYFECSIKHITENSLKCLPKSQEGLKKLGSFIKSINKAGHFLGSSESTEKEIADIFNYQGSFEDYEKSLNFDREELQKKIKNEEECFINFYENSLSRKLKDEKAKRLIEIIKKKFFKEKDKTVKNFELDKVSPLSFYYQKMNEGKLIKISSFERKKLELILDNIDKIEKDDLEILSNLPYKEGLSRTVLTEEIFYKVFKGLKNDKEKTKKYVIWLEGMNGPCSNDFLLCKGTRDEFNNYPEEFKDL